MEVGVPRPHLTLISTPFSARPNPHSLAFLLAVFAVLKIEAAPEDLIPVEVGVSSRLVVGQRVFAIGNPFGLDHTLVWWA